MEFCRQFNMLFHINTRHYLSYRLPRSCPRYLENIGRFSNLVIDKNDILIDNSACLAAYGLRDSRDIDFLHRSNWHIVDDSIECHNVTFGISAFDHYSQILDLDSTLMVDNPDLFFYAYGFKHLQPEHVAAFKNLRLNSGLNRPKDHKDIKLVTNYLNSVSHLNKSNPPVLFRDA